MDSIDKLDDDSKKEYTDAWDENKDGIQCFEDLFQIAGSLIDSSNALEFTRRGRRNAMATDRDRDEAKAVAAEDRKKRWKEISEKLNKEMPDGVHRSHTKIAAKLAKLQRRNSFQGYRRPGVTGHCLLPNSECPGTKEIERSRPAKTVSDTQMLGLADKPPPEDTDTTQPESTEPQPKCVSGRKKSLLEEDDPYETSDSSDKGTADDGPADEAKNEDKRLVPGLPEVP